MIYRLTRNVRMLAQKYFILVSFLNPLGAAIIVGPTIFLLALSYGADDLQMGFLYGGLYIAGLAAMFAPLVLGGREVSRVVAWTWLLRSCVAVGFLSLPFLPSDSYKLYVLIAVFYVFLVLRALGMVAFYPMIRAMSTKTELPKLLACNVSRWNFGSIIASAATYLVFRFQDRFPSEEWTFVGMLAAATLLQFLATWGYMRMPRLEQLNSSSISRIKEAARVVFKQHYLRETLLATLLIVPLGIFNGYVVSYMKNYSGWGNTPIFLFSVLGLVAAVLASNGLRLIGSRLSTRSLLFGSGAVMVVLSFFWCMIQSLPHHEYVAAVLMILGVPAWTVMVNGWAQLLSGRLPEGHRVEVSSLYTLNSALCALLGIGLVQLTEPIGLRWGQAIGCPYLHCFGLLGVFGFLLALLSLKMHDSRRTITQDLSMLRPWSLYTLLRMGQVERMDRNQRRVRMMEGLMSAPTQASRERMLEALDSPDMMIRYSVYRMLNETPIPEAYGPALREAVCPDSPIRTEAITALGFLSNQEALSTLASLMDSPDQQVRANAMKSALRLGAELSDEDILTIYKGLTTTRFRMQVLFGLVSAGRQKCIGDAVVWELKKRPDPTWIRPLFVFWASALHDQDRTLDVYELESERMGEGLQMILQEYEACRDDSAPSGDHVRDIFARDAYEELGAMLPIQERLLPVFERNGALGLLSIYVHMQPEE